MHYFYAVVVSAIKFSTLFKSALAILCSSNRKKYVFLCYLDRGERTYPISYAHTYVVHTFIALSWCGPQLGSPLHSGSKWLKSAKNKFTQSDFTTFPYKSQHILITSIFGLCVRLIFKNLSNHCRHISMTRHFHGVLYI